MITKCTLIFVFMIVSMVQMVISSPDDGREKSKSTIGDAAKKKLLLISTKTSPAITDNVEVRSQKLLKSNPPGDSRGCAILKKLPSIPIMVLNSSVNTVLGVWKWLKPLKR